MIALVRLSLATFFLSQRYVAPLLLFVGTVGILTNNDEGPLTATYATCAAVMFVCSAWLTIALTSVEDPVHRAVAVVSSGSSARVLAATVTVAVLSCAALLVPGLTFPLIFGRHTVTVLDLLVGTLAQLTCAAVGIAIGLICSRLVLRRQGYAVLIALSLVLLVLFWPGLPPVNAMFRLLGDNADPAVVLGQVGVFLVLGLVLLALSTVATQYRTTRRD